MKTGELIKQLRLKKGFTQEDLAARTEISVRTIQRIENGEVDPRAYTLQSIADALEVDFEELNHMDLVAIEKKADELKWLPLIHLSGLFLLIIPPIIIWIWKRDKIEDIQKHAYDVINFQLSMTLYLLPFALLGVYPILIVFGLYSQVVIIINTVKATNNQPYKYPLNIKFLKENVSSLTV